MSSFFQQINSSKALFLALLFLISFSFSNAQTSYSWSASAASSNWNTAFNWIPNGTPSSIDNVVIVNSANTPVLPANTTIKNFTMTSGSIDLGLNTLTINGTSVFTAGTVNNGTIAPSGATVTFTGTTFNATLTAVCASVTINGGTYNNTVSIQKSGAAINTGNGGTTFNGATTIINSGSNILRMANTTADTYNAQVTFTNTGTSYIDVAYGAASGTRLNDNVVVNSTRGAGIRFGQAAGTVVLAAGKTISVGVSGYSVGNLELRNFTQTGSTAQSLTLTGTASIYFETGTTFNGNLNAAAPQILLNGTTFNGAVTIQKTGTSNNAGVGGNTFNGATTLKNSGSAYLMAGNGIADVFNGTLDLITIGTGALNLANATATTSFNQNVTVNATSSGTISFGGGAGLSALAAGKTIAVGALGFSGSATLLLRNFTQTGSTAQSLILAGTSNLTIGAGSTFNGDVNFTSPQILLNGCTYNGTVTVRKTGAGNNSSFGNNTFNAAASFSNSGTGFFRLANTNGDVFNSTLTLTNTGIGYIDVAYGAVTGTYLNDNVIVNSTAGIGIRFGQGTGLVTLAVGKTVTVGATGFTAGNLQFRNFTQLSSTPQSFTLTGTSIIYFESGATFNGDVNAAAPQIYLNGTTFNGVTTIEKTGATPNIGLGGNTFNGLTILKNSGSSNLVSANTSVDIFNTDLTLTATSTGSIYMANVAAGVQFNGNIVVNSSSSGGIFLGSGAACGSTLAAGKTVTIGTFSGSGILQFKRFTQTTATAQSLTLTGTSTLTLASGNTFNGDVNFTAPQVFLSGTTFNGSATIKKNGATDNAGAGGNIFNGTTVLTASGSGYFMTGNGSADNFNADVTLNNSGIGILHLAYATATANFAGNIVLNNTNTGGIYFGNFGGSTILASGKTLSMGASGFSSSGALWLRNFTQLGSAAQTLALTGTGSLTVGTGSTFNGNVDFTAAQILLNGCTYNGTASFNRTGSAANLSAGANTFNGIATFTNSGTGILYIDNTGNDVFNDNIIVNSTGGSDIRFGSGTGAASLASGKTISVGVGGFSSGGLYLKNFTQNGSTSQSITLTGTAALHLQSGSTFNGTFNALAPQIFLNGSVFNAATAIEKNGATDNTSTGANIYNAGTTIKNSGSGIMYLASTSADDFNTLVTFIQTGAGALYPAYNSTSTFSGNISTAGTSTAITFAAGGSGRVNINGGAQSISGSSAQTPVIRRLTVSGGGAFTLNVPVNISTGGDLNMSSGTIVTTSANLLTLQDETVTSTVGNSSSYVNGPLAYTMSLSGSRTLNFPVGKGSDWRPAVLNLTHNAATAYTYIAERFNSSAQTFGFTKPSTIEEVSAYSYWDISRSPSSSANLTGGVVTFYYGSAGTDDHVTDYTGLTIGKSNGAGAWVDLIASATANNDGSITSGSFTSFSKFALANTMGGNNALPVELINFSAEKKSNQVDLLWSTASEINNDYFTVERSVDGKNFETIGTADGTGNNNAVLNYNFTDSKPVNGESYYRLKQSDFDGKFTYSKIVQVIFIGTQSGMQVYQNADNNIQVNLFSVSANEQVRICLFDVSGKLIQEQKVIASSNGNYSGVIVLENASVGIYTVVSSPVNAQNTQKIAVR